MTIAILGGSGFLGRNLTHYLLRNTDWTIRVVSHKRQKFNVEPFYANRIQFVTGNVLDRGSLLRAINGVDVVYYFVHMMGQKDGDFYELEKQAAENAKAVVANSSVKRLIYMGGLGNPDDMLSDHLASRHRTGEILRSMPIDVIEFQASMIIGRGSVAFDIISSLVDKLPLMVLPRKAKTLTQPIALADVLAYLHDAATVRMTKNTVVQIGGPDVMSYEDIYRMYADFVTKKRYVIRVPLLPARLEALFLDLFTPKVHARIGRAMVDSMGSEMIVRSPNEAKRLFPAIKPTHVRKSLRRLAE